MITRVNQLVTIGSRNAGLIWTNNAREFSLSTRFDAGKLWRQSVGLPKLQTARGALTDLPDYSFVDGRPVPPSVGQLERKGLQKQLTQQIVSGLEYIKRADAIFKEKELAIPKLLPYIEKAKPIAFKKKSTMQSTRSKKKN